MGNQEKWGKWGGVLATLEIEPTLLLDATPLAAELSSTVDRICKTGSLLPGHYVEK